MPVARYHPLAGDHAAGSAGNRSSGLAGFRSHGMVRHARTRQHAARKCHALEWRNHQSDEARRRARKAARPGRRAGGQYPRTVRAHLQKEIAKWARIVKASEARAD